MVFLFRASKNQGHQEDWARVLPFISVRTTLVLLYVDSTQSRALSTFSLRRNRLSLFFIQTPSAGFSSFFYCSFLTHRIYLFISYLQSSYPLPIVFEHYHAEFWNLFLFFDLVMVGRAYGESTTIFLYPGVV